MPIRSPRGRAAAYRALWQWPLRSPARLALTVAVAALAAVAVTTGLAAVAGPPPALAPAAAPSASGPTATTRPGTAARTPTPTALPPVPDLVPATLPPTSADPDALDVAARWAAAWVRPPEGTTAAQWLDGLRPLTTDEYLGVLGTVDPGNVPATQVTGSPRPVRTAESSVRVEVPTDTVVLEVLVVRTERGEWRVSGYDQA